MLALTDEALARICIAASSVPTHKRKKFLKRIAARVDPSRQLRYYRRQSNGTVSVTLEGNCDDIALLLRRFDIITDPDNRASLAAGLAKLMEVHQHYDVVLRQR